MTREEAAREVHNIACCFSDKRIRDVMHMAADALRGPQPDPITSLVPCGCGGKAETHELFGLYSGTYMTDCKECATGTTQYNTKKESQDAWNTAMSGGRKND